MILRFFRELFDPIEKCCRVGHKFQLFGRRTFRTDQPYSIGIVDICNEEQSKCVRCGLVEKDWEIVHSRSIDSLSMSSEYWDDLYRKKYFVELGPYRIKDYE